MELILDDVVIILAIAVVDVITDDEVVTKADVELLITVVPGPTDVLKDVEIAEDMICDVDIMIDDEVVGIRIVEVALETTTELDMKAVDDVVGTINEEVGVEMIFELDVKIDVDVVAIVPIDVPSTVVLGPIDMLTDAEGTEEMMDDEADGMIVDSVDTMTDDEMLVCETEMLVGGRSVVVRRELVVPVI
ncbi:hypothetical protein BKA67DRAFT_657708 [Truncatella angustata]|uniref:Uncharacterized protein n=1 Tax=Truncatella angustata TaxID=152316 RepID=A0A9P8UPL9_9PEZI|nr:uncharacterized protein BKA67DRAFT_657708 [Truncatella angustata]KAH6655796.1 hypothetical protein BKA67DRAFT_657708 [Truncatella angustata]